MFLFLAILSVFLFWAAKNFGDTEGTLGNVPLFLAGIVSLCLSIVMGLFCFIRYLRNKTVAGGLFLTTAASTAVFLGASQLIGTLLPPFLAAGIAVGEDPAVAGGGLGLMILLAQIGLFTLWFGFLLFTIKAYVRPVGKINSYLKKIKDGERIGRVRVGKSKQYREIEQTLRELANQTCQDINTCNILECESKKATEDYHD